MPKIEKLIDEGKLTIDDFNCPALELIEDIP